MRFNLIFAVSMGLLLTSLSVLAIPIEQPDLSSENTASTTPSNDVTDLADTTLVRRYAPVLPVHIWKAIKSQVSSMVANGLVSPKTHYRAWKAARSAGLEIGEWGAKFYKDTVEAKRETKDKYRSGKISRDEYRKRMDQHKLNENVYFTAIRMVQNEARANHYALHRAKKEQSKSGKGMT
jgi:hypothetical protein